MRLNKSSIIILVLAVYILFTSQQIWAESICITSATGVSINIGKKVESPREELVGSVEGDLKLKRQRELGVNYVVHFRYHEYLTQLITTYKSIKEKQGISSLPSGVLHAVMDQLFFQLSDINPVLLGKFMDHFLNCNPDQFKTEEKYSNHPFGLVLSIISKVENEGDILRAINIVKTDLSNWLQLIDSVPKVH